MDARPVELELKYRVTDLTAGRRLLQSSTLGSFHASGAPRTTQHEDHYVDTADGALARAGFAARLRQAGGATVISVKSLSSGASALHRRDELEGPADRSLPPTDWPSSDARALLLEHCGDAPLVELVTIRQLRHRRRFAVDATDVELSLDEADVVDRGRIVDHFTELEIELVAGDVAPLEALELALASEPGLEAALGSKFEMALRAAGITVPGLRAARPAPRLELVASGFGSEPAGDTAEATPTPDPAAPSGGEAATRTLDPEHPSIGTNGVGRAPGTARTAGPDGTRRSRPARRPRVTGDGAQHDDPGPGPATERADDEHPVTPGSQEGEMAPEGRATTMGAGIVVDIRPTSASLTVDGTAEAAAEPELPKLFVGKSPGVRADDTLAEAGRKILRFHLARMLAREPGTRTGADAEDLHSMRVATRRMRAAWRVFGDSYRPNRTRRYRLDLRDVAARLGAVRDLDVLIEGLEAYARGQTETERGALEPLLETWRSRREEARALLLKTLDSAGYQRFVEEYREFVRTDGLAVLPVTPTAPHRIRDTMPSRIWAAYEHLRAYEPVLRWADVETLHELRIAAKWLRYTIEFVKEPLGPDAGPLIERVVALQDHLGNLHDADVAAGLARSFLVERAGDLEDVETAAIGRYLMDRERELHRLRRTIGPTWRRVTGLAYRRSLGRVVAGL
jgi:CHAD domain-containing protein